MTQDAVEPTVDDAPDPSDTPAILAPTREDLEAQTKAELADTYDVSDSLSKADMVDAVLAKYGIATPRSGQVILAVNPVTSSEHHWAIDQPPITPEGTAVPADQAEAIIAAAASGGVQIREVN